MLRRRCVWQINAEQLDGLRESCSARFPDITFLGRNQTYFAGTAGCRELSCHAHALTPSLKHRTHQQGDVADPAPEDAPAGAGRAVPGHRPQARLLCGATLAAACLQAHLTLPCCRCFPCGRDVLQEFLAQKAEIVVASDYDGHPGRAVLLLAEHSHSQRTDSALLCRLLEGGLVSGGGPARSQLLAVPHAQARIMLAAMQVPTGLPPKARRYINSGTVMGRAKHLQALLVRYMLIHAQHLQLKEFHDQARSACA